MRKQDSVVYLPAQTGALETFSFVDFVRFEELHCGQRFTYNNHECHDNFGVFNVCFELFLFPEWND